MKRPSMNPSRAFGFIAVVTSIFLLFLWNQYSVNKQYTGTTFNKHNKIKINNPKEFSSNEMRHINSQTVSKTKQELNKKTKYIIFYCAQNSFCGGWGDRQHGIVSVYLMALAMGRRFGIIVSKPCDISKYLEPNKINWTIDPKELHGLKSHYLILTDNRKYISSLRSADLETLYPKDVLYVTTNRIFFHALKKNALYKEQLHWALNMSYGDLFAETMDSLFHFRDDFQERFDNFFKVNIPKSDMHLVCVQIRIGKNPAMPQDMRRMSISEAQIVWNFLSKYNNTSKYKIFVTTDSEEVQAMASTKFASQIVYNPGEIIHVDRLRSGVRDMCDSVRKILMDQYILTKCDTLIVSRSGFGENAVLMNEKGNNLYHFKDRNITQIIKGKFSPIWERTWL